MGLELAELVARVEEATATHRRVTGADQKLPTAASLVNQLSVTCMRFNVAMVRGLVDRCDGLCP